jgi:template-activating factor I
MSTGYSITFNFNDNLYFHNPSIVKSLTFHKGKLEEVKATTIQWKEGKSMPNVARPKWYDGRAHEQSSYDLSFFNWFHSRKEKNELKYGDQIADLIKNFFWIDPLKNLVETDEDDNEEDKIIKFIATLSRNINSGE